MEGADFDLIGGSAVVSLQWLHAETERLQAALHSVHGGIGRRQHGHVARTEAVTRAHEIADVPCNLVDLGVQTLDLDEKRPWTPSYRRDRLGPAFEHLAKILDPMVSGDGHRRVDDLTRVAIVLREHRGAAPHLYAGLAQREPAGIDALRTVAEDEQAVRAVRLMVRGVDQCTQELQSGQGQVLRFVHDHGRASSRYASICASQTRRPGPWSHG